jgi:hypothetical protein
VTASRTALLFVGWVVFAGAVAWIATVSVSI